MKTRIERSKLKNAKVGDVLPYWHPVIEEEDLKENFEVMEVGQRFVVLNTIYHPQVLNLTVLLGEAIRISVEAHDGQKDKSGMPYILHPIRVMNSVNSTYDKICAILHDVVEDTDVTEAQILKTFGWNIWGTIMQLTHKPEDTYEEYIDRMNVSSSAVRIKLADLEDNMDLTRLLEITDRDIERTQKYVRAKATLIKKQNR